MGKYAFMKLGYNDKASFEKYSMHLQSAEYQKVKGDLQIKHVFAGLICI